MLTENEQVKGEVFKPTERIKLYVVEVKNTTKGPKTVSYTHLDVYKRQRADRRGAHLHCHAASL